VETSKHAPVTHVGTYYAESKYDVYKASDTDCLSCRGKKQVNSMRYVTGKSGTQANGKVRKISTSHFRSLWKRTPWRHLKPLNPDMLTM
jgi:hypothetical protein